MSWTTHARRGLIAAALPLLLAGGAQPAWGASVRVVHGSAVYEADDGESNRARAWRTPGSITLREEGPVTITALEGCRRGTTDSEVVCADARGLGQVDVHARDGDDSVRVEDVDAQLFGGTGDDTLLGGSGDDHLDGGEGADVLRGGGGHDSVTYWSRLAPVDVAPGDDADDGAAGEGDLVAPDVESVLGGSAADTLTAGEAPARLSGAPGDDRLTGGDAADHLLGGDGVDLVAGGGADDVIDGGTGEDLLSGGPGNDSILARDGSRDAVSCEEGTDAVVADAVDVVDRATCEHVDVPVQFAVPAPLPATTRKARAAKVRPVRPPDTTPPAVRLARTATVRRGTSVRIRVSCPASELDGCSGWVRLSTLAARGRGRPLGTGSFNVLGGRSAEVRVGMSRSARRLLRGRRLVRATMVSRDGGGNVTRRRSRVVLAR
jgi:hypothetical protein